MGTLAHILLYGEPQLDSRDRPLLFYSTLIHDRCPRRSYFDKGIFAENEDSLVVIKADRNVILNKAVQVMDIAKAAGAGRLSLATEKGF